MNLKNCIISAVVYEENIFCFYVTGCNAVLKQKIFSGVFFCILIFIILKNGYEFNKKICLCLLNAAGGIADVYA